MKRAMKFGGVFAGAVSAALLMSAFATARADQTGMADMHAQARSGGKRCFIDHTHYGNSSGERSRAAAQRSAISSWRSFTDFEYGSDWASWGKAIGKRMSCSNSGGGWDCAVEARPCR